MQNPEVSGGAFLGALAFCAKSWVSGGAVLGGIGVLCKTPRGLEGLFGRPGAVLGLSWAVLGLSWSVLGLGVEGRILDGVLGGP